MRRSGVRSPAAPPSTSLISLHFSPCAPFLQSATYATSVRRARPLRPRVTAQGAHTEAPSGHFASLPKPPQFRQRHIALHDPGRTGVPKVMPAECPEARAPVRFLKGTRSQSSIDRLFRWSTCAAVRIGLRCAISFAGSEQRAAAGMHEKDIARFMAAWPAVRRDGQRRMVSVATRIVRSGASGQVRGAASGGALRTGPIRSVGRVRGHAVLRSPGITRKILAQRHPRRR